MYRNISPLEVPEHLYQIRRTVKSYFVFEFGNLFAIWMVVVAVVVVVFLVYKVRAQKDRAKLIQKAVTSYGNH
jgi:hypothetical protein